MQEKTFLLLLSFWTENILKLEKDQEVFICINIYLPHCVTYLEIQTLQVLKYQPFHATRNQLKASIFLFEHSRLHGKDPVKMIYPVKFLKTLYIQKCSFYTVCLVLSFVLHTRNNQDTKVMKQTTVHVHLRKFKKLLVWLSWNNQDIKVRKQDCCTV